MTQLCLHVNLFVSSATLQLLRMWLVVCLCRQSLHKSLIDFFPPFQVGCSGEGVNRGIEQEFEGALLEVTQCPLFQLLRKFSLNSRIFHTFTQFVTSVRISLQFLKNRVEHEKKNHWAQGVPLKYPTLEFESICSPRLGVHDCQAM